MQLHNSLCNSLRNSLTCLAPPQFPFATPGWLDGLAALAAGRQTEDVRLLDALERQLAAEEAAAAVRAAELADAHAALERADAEAEALEAARAELQALLDGKIGELRASAAAAGADGRARSSLRRSTSRSRR